jgi:ABC-type transport system substrate-binding protein
MLSKPSKPIIFVLSSLLVILILSYYCLGLKNTKDMKPQTTLWIPEAPYSTDTLDFDLLMHHIVFSSVFSPLVSEYKTGTVTGMIAKSWSSSEDFKEWRFEIKSGLQFSNGDLITPEIVIKSLKRIFFLLKNRGSKNGVVENILGIEKLNSLYDSIPGLLIDPSDTSSIKFVLSKPIKNFLTLISFGMYSIVHPSLYDSNTGLWLDKKTAISSGAYVISSWNEKEILLKLRSNYQSPFDIENNNKLSEVLISWSAQENQNKLYDLKYGTSDENQKSNSGKLEYHGGTISEIRFVRCLSWYLPFSPCSNLEQRTLMRDIFYKNLRTLGFSPVNSFFPLVMNGIKEIEYNPKLIKPVANSKKITVNINATNASNPIVKEGYISSLQAIADTYNFALNIKQVSSGKIYEDIELQPNNPNVDICSNVSGIYIDKPQDDVQFMFKSKEGVMIPDTDGRIMAELDHSPVDLQRVNELIWEQAVVWPLTHYGIGFWSVKDAYDFSAINLSKSPTMFELIRKK